MQSWKLQDAKARLSELIKIAVTTGQPQIITLRDDPSVVVLSKSEYEKLVHPKPSFVDFLQNSPLAGVALNIQRDPSHTREIDL